MMKIRCVVTGHDDQGRSVFSADDDMDPLTVSLAPGIEFHRIWGADQVPTIPNQPSVPRSAAFFPPMGGFRVHVTTFPVEPAASPVNLDMSAAMNEAEEKLAGLLGHMEPDNPGMHTTASVDVDIVLSGELVLELDDGAETPLRTGDIVVQNGTRHRWHNRGPVPAQLAAFLVGAGRTGHG
jgi:mannose-6-phosphate isomerase-like protein (cupin superfamily)